MVSEEHFTQSTVNTWFGHVHSLTLEEEAEIVKDIQAGVNQDTGEYRTKKAEKGVATLVNSYSPFIEKISREKYRSAGGYGYSFEDFLAEGYLVAVQCAKKFDPSKSKKPIRFSSYVSRAIASSLGRMSMRSRSIVHVPTTVMSKARAWSRVYYDMLNKGIEPDDETVSELSGIDSTAQEVLSILGSTFDHPIEDDSHPHVSDAIVSMDSESQKKVLEDVIMSAYGEKDGRNIIIALGISSGVAKTSRIDSIMGGDKIDDKDFYPKLVTFLNHPMYKVLRAKRFDEKMISALRFKGNPRK